MSLVIVTKRCYLLCEDIVSITVQEVGKPVTRLRLPKKGKKRYPSAHEPMPDGDDSKQFKIDIIYFEPTRHGRQSDATDSLAIEVCGSKETAKLFAEIVREIREQKPDATYLDSIVEKALGLVPNNTVR